MLRNPKKLVLSLLAFDVVCFVIAGMVGQHQDGWVSGMPQWLGDIAWFGLLLGVLVTVLAGIWLLISTLRGRSRPTTG
ncbi:MAG: hypothetical protein QOE05_1863 [Actinomycetota bacterium]|jgi:hypothetical protein|nr:hypothetical protein [Actinomycetota bacterium]